MISARLLAVLRETKLSKEGFMDIRRMFRAEIIMVSLMISLPFGFAPRPVLAHMQPLTDRQLVHGSEHIVVAVVENVRSRWNPQHTLIFTDYELRIEDRLKGRAPERITLSMPGGTLDGETHGTCLSTSLAKSGRYLLFLGDLARPTLSPTTGAQQGVFRELAAKDGRRYVSSGGDSEVPLTMEGSPVEFRNFVEAMRGFVVQVEASPKPGDALPKGRSGTDPELPAKTWDPHARPPKGSWTSAVPLAGRAEEPPLPWTDWVDKAGTGMAVEASSFQDETHGPEGMPEKYLYEGRPPAPIVFDNFPPGFSFAPHDQYQMSSWNVYAKNLFQVYVSPSNTWAFGNGVYDLAGFPGNDQMINQFGDTWGAGVLGVTYFRLQNGTLVEADVALNPAYSWTVDDRTGTRPGFPVSFSHVMLHELGHAWGLKHTFQTHDVWWDSVMNYSTQEYYLAKLSADDATAARTAYPGIAIRDGFISSYTTQDTLFNNNATYVPSYPFPSVVRAGGSFTLVNPIKVENNGTVNLSNLTVEVYLVPQRFSFTGSRLLRSLRYSVTVRPFTTQRLDVGSLTVPRSVPPGTYYLAFFLRDSKDKNQGNNSAWSNYNVTLTVAR
jgi:hypothetical protein